MLNDADLMCWTLFDCQYVLISLLMPIVNMRQYPPETGIYCTSTQNHFTTFTVYFEACSQKWHYHHQTDWLTSHQLWSDWYTSKGGASHWNHQIFDIQTSAKNPQAEPYILLSLLDLCNPNETNLLLSQYISYCSTSSSPSCFAVKGNPLLSVKNRRRQHADAIDTQITIPLL